MQYNHPHGVDCLCYNCHKRIIKEIDRSRTPECYGTNQITPECGVCTYQNNCEGMRMGRCLD